VSESGKENKLTYMLMPRSHLRVTNGVFVLACIMGDTVYVNC